MLYEISQAAIATALLIVYFTLLRKVINLKMAHKEPKHAAERNNVRNTS